MKTYENAFYVNTDEPTDIVTLETIRKRYIQINGTENGFMEYVRNGFYDGIFQEYKRITL